MTDIVRGHNTSYARYEELINRRDDVRKEAFHYHNEYVRTFGDLVLGLFEKKIECIRKKKTIDYCQVALNHGKEVEQNALQEYLQKEMADFQSQLSDMIQERKAVLTSTIITEKDIIEIKQIYHRLVKKIHPDINPSVANSEQLTDLWHRVSASYACNDLKGLQELEVLVNQAVDTSNSDKLDIPNIDDKIAALEKEITEIMDRDPYQYKFLLEDDRAVETKREDLHKELKNYEDYSKQLDEILEGILGSGVKITWQMNCQ